MKRYSAIAIFDTGIGLVGRVVLIEKQKPAWQAGKANFPGGKVELQDWPLPNRSDDDSPDYEGAAQEAHLTCAIRELAEETSLVVNPNDVKHFATLRFTTDGQPGECRFFCCIGDVDAATSKEAERVFVDDVFSVMHGQVSYCTDRSNTPRYHFLDTMPNLPWLCAMARQRLRSGYDGADVHVVEEVGRSEKKAAQPQHSASCRQSKALGAVAIECEHGFDFCPTCDACNCEVSK